MGRISPWGRPVPRSRSAERSGPQPGERSGAGPERGAAATVRPPPRGPPGAPESFSVLGAPSRGNSVGWRGGRGGSEGAYHPEGPSSSRRGKTEKPDGDGVGGRGGRAGRTGWVETGEGIV